jgi:hypothetical protein
VATTISSRGSVLSAAPSQRSDVPAPYSGAVSNARIPSSYARVTMAAVVSAPLSGGRLANGAPPRLNRETRSPVRPNGTRSPGSGMVVKKDTRLSR